MNIYNAVPGEPLPLGHRWENNALRIVFDISAWVDAFGVGTVRLLHQRQGDAAPYPVSVTRTDADGTPNDETGTRVLWDVSRTDTAQVCHFGRAELRYYAGREGAEEFLAKSDIWKTEVRDALGGAQADAPEAQREWLDELLAKADGIEANVAAAQEAQAQAQAAATRIGNFFFYIDRDPESETFRQLIWVHDSNTDYNPEAPRIVASGNEWRLDSNGVLTIAHAGPLNSLPDLGDYSVALRRVVLEDITSIGSRLFRNCGDLESVVIPNSATRIGEGAFSRCVNLASVEIPPSVTAIDDNAFFGCNSLNSVIIHDGVAEIGDYAFYGCSHLSLATIPNSVTFIGTDAFYNCSSLVSVTIPDSVTRLGGGVFDRCALLNDVTIGNGVTNIPSLAFKDCSSLVSVTIPDSVRSIGDRAFERCAALADMTIPVSVKSIGQYAFSACAALANVYYKGSEEQRSAITITNAISNQWLTSATWHYNWEG